MKGVSLVEMIIYIAILSLMLLVIVGMLYIISTSGRTLTASKEIENSGDFSLERMTREIRNATSIDQGQSTLGSNPGVLSLQGTDLSGNAQTVKFFQVANTLHVTYNGVDQGALTTANAKVTNLVFTQITTANSQGVRIVMTVQSGTGTAFRSENFYSTVILRGSL